MRDEPATAAAICTRAVSHPRRPASARTWATRAVRALIVVLAAAFTVAVPAIADAATPTPTVPGIEPVAPIEPIEPIATIPPVDVGPIVGPTLPAVGDENATEGTTIGIGLPDVTEKPSNAVVLILVLSVLSIAPSILVMMTSFTRIVIVMSLTRNALGIPQLPPQQVIVGLSLFLTMFVMGPTLSELNEVALQPLLDQEISFTDAARAAETPMREFMMDYTREPELKLFLDASGTATPVSRDEVPLTALIPAFVLSELKSAFILGFMIMIPFLVIDLVVSAVLTSLGMMMLPPTFVSLPLKILLFVLLDGWVLVTGTLLESYT